MVSSGGVTIQKATIGLSNQNNTPVSRTIALPYGTSSSLVTSTQASMASLATSIASGKLIASSTNSTTTTLSAIPIARVCPQPLSSNNLVTISTSATLPGGATQDGGGVYITRTNSGHPLQQLAINLSTTGSSSTGGTNQFGQNLSAANKSNNKIRPNLNVVTHLNLPKINLPTQPARLLNFPGQQQQQQQQQHQFIMSGPASDVSHHLIEQQQQQQQQQQRLPTNSPRPSILRRREGERELMMPGNLPFEFGALFKKTRLVKTSFKGLPLLVLDFVKK